MRYPCPFKRSGCMAKPSIAALRTLTRNLQSTISCQLGSKRRNSSSKSPYQSDLIRRHKGRRQRVHRWALSAAALQSWSPKEHALSKTEWLHSAKQQGTEALLTALLTPEDVPLPRLPVLLTLLERCPDLESCLHAAGPRVLIDAVLRSNILQRLLPSGTLQELLLNWLQDQALDLSPSELLSAARLLAAWPPPAHAEVAAATAAALAAAITHEALAYAGGEAARLSTRSTYLAGNGSTPPAAAETAAVLSEALLHLHPWLSWRAEGEDEDSGLGGDPVVASAASSFQAASSYDEAGKAEGGAAQGEGGLRGARAAVAALLLRPAGRGAVPAEAGLGVLQVVVSAATVYGVEVPADLARAVANLAADPSSRSSCSNSAGALTSADTTPAHLAAQIIATAIASARSDRHHSPAPAPCPPLTARDIRALAASQLSPRLDSRQHATFLRSMLDKLQLLLSQQRLQELEDQEEGGRNWQQQEDDQAAEGLFLALGDAAAAAIATADVTGAGGVSSHTLALITLTLECAAASLALYNPAVGSVEVVQVQAAVRQLLAAANAAAQQAKQSQAQRQQQQQIRVRSVGSADELCRVAAAAVQLVRSADCLMMPGGGDGAGGSAGAQYSALLHGVLAAVTAQLHEARAEAVAALIAADVVTPAPSGSARGKAAAAGTVGRDHLEGGGRDGRTEAGTANAVLPYGTLDALFKRLVAAKAEGAADKAEGQAFQTTAGEATDDEGGILSSDAAFDGTTRRPLSYAQALAVLIAAVTAVEKAASTAPSTNAAQPTPIALRHNDSEDDASPPPPHLAALRAAAWVTWRPLIHAVHGVDANAAIHLLHLLARCRRAGLRINTKLLWTLHARLCDLAPSLPTPAVLAVLRDCISLRWRPSMLLRYLLTPLLNWLEDGAPGMAPPLDGASRVPSAVRQSLVQNLDVVPSPSVRRRQYPQHSALDDVVLERDGTGPRVVWTAAQLQQVLVCLARMQYRGPLVAPLLKWGVGALIRQAPGGGGAREGQQGLWAGELGTLMWVCVELRHRGPVQLRALLQQLLQVPASQVPVRAAAKVVWAAARLGISSERLVRWVLSSCQGAGKLAGAPPSCLAHLCWGLAKLGVTPPQDFISTITPLILDQPSTHRPANLATLLFILAIWGAHLPHAATRALVRHVAARRNEFEGPALCTAVWALQRLSSSPPSPPSSSSIGASTAARVVVPGSSGGVNGEGEVNGAPAAAVSSTPTNRGGMGETPDETLRPSLDGGDGAALGVAAVGSAATDPLAPSPLDAASLAAVEDRLLELLLAKKEGKLGSWGGVTNGTNTAHEDHHYHYEQEQRQQLKHPQGSWTSASNMPEPVSDIEHAAITGSAGSGSDDGLNKSDASIADSNGTSSGTPSDKPAMFRVPDIHTLAFGIADHHLLRFLTAAATADYRPTRLLTPYTARLTLRLTHIRARPRWYSPTSPEAAARSRLLWCFARVMSLFDMRGDAELLAALEVAGIYCQGVLRPGHLAGVLHALATLGAFPARWLAMGLLRRVGLALREANVTETGLLLEAMALWRLHVPESPWEVRLAERDADMVAAAVAAVRPVRPVNIRLASQAEAGVDVELGLGDVEGTEMEPTRSVDSSIRATRVWVGSEGEAAAVGRGAQEESRPRLTAQAPASPSSPIGSQQLEKLRQVALARLMQLCVPPSLLQPPGQQLVPSPPSLPSSGSSTQNDRPQGQQQEPQQQYPLSSVDTPPSPNQGPATTTATIPTPTTITIPVAITSREPLPPIAPEDALRLLTSLARLRWRCPPLQQVLVAAVAPLIVVQRQRVPELTTLLWSLAWLRHDAPELLDELQAVLLGQSAQRSLVTEVAMMEDTGRMTQVATSGAPSDAGGDPDVGPTGSGISPQPPPGTGAVRSSVTIDHVDDDSATAARVPVAESASTTTAISHSADNTAPQGSNNPSAIQQPTSTTTTTSATTTLLSRPVKSPSQPSTPVASGPAYMRVAAPPLQEPGAPPLDPTATMPAAVASSPGHQDSGPPSSHSRPSPADSDSAGSSRGLLPTEPWRPADVFMAMWAAAKMNRNPGPMVLAAAEESWMLATSSATVSSASGHVGGEVGDGSFGPGKGSGGQGQGQELYWSPPPPLHAITGLLWALSVFRLHNGSFAQQLAGQLAARLRLGGRSEGAWSGRDRGEVMWEERARVSAEGMVEDVELREDMEAFGLQTMQVAACLLAAQADRVDSPLNTALPPETRARLVAAWRARLAARVARPPNRYQEDMVAVLRKMGLTAAANVTTPDGCMVVDVAVALKQPPQAAGTTTAAAAAVGGMSGADNGAGSSRGSSTSPPPPLLLALELVGRHNSAANSRRITGEAVIKYRLLQARGYLVVPIPCAEWDRIQHQDVWTKIAYLQTRIDRRTHRLLSGGTGAAASPPAAAQVTPTAANNNTPTSATNNTSAAAAPSIATGALSVISTAV